MRCLLVFLLLSSEKPETVDVTFADFDGVQFHISASPDAKHLLKISIQFKGAQQVLKEFGGLELLKRYYGPLVQSTPEASYDVTLQIDLNSLPPGKGIPQSNITTHLSNTISPLLYSLSNAILHVRKNTLTLAQMSCQPSLHSSNATCLQHPSRRLLRRSHQRSWSSTTVPKRPSSSKPRLTVSPSSSASFSVMLMILFFPKFSCRYPQFTLTPRPHHHPSPPSPFTFHSPPQHPPPPPHTPPLPPYSPPLHPPTTPPPTTNTPPP